MVLEICVDSIESAKAAQQGGAHRVELCAALSEGGITPSSGLIEGVRAALMIPMFVIIRPRGGDFFYSDDEFGVMEQDIIRAKDHGADGVVLGILCPNGDVDVIRTRKLVDLSRPLEVTFHRAIDWAPHIDEAVEQVIQTGAERILTSGGAQTAIQGAATISRMVAQAAGRINVMVGGAVRSENIGKIAKTTLATEFHASLRRRSSSPVSYYRSGFSLGISDIEDFTRYAVAPDDVRTLLEGMESVKHHNNSINVSEAIV
jgi:copper homeostasis protein